MRLGLRLIIALVISISLVTFIVARNQVRDDKTTLRADLARRGEILTESLQETIEPVLQRGAINQLPRIVQRFGGREHLTGIAVYNPDGKVLAASTNLGLRPEFPPKAFTECKASGHADGEFEALGSSRMYVYALPLHRDGSIAGVLVTFHDADYIDAQSTQIWGDTLWHVIAQVLLIALITSLVIRWTILSPITRLSQWMKDLRAGRAGPFPQPGPDDFLQSLTSEAANLAQSLSEARTTAKEEAQLRDAGDSLWTADRLRAGVQRHMRGSSLFVVSNREPYEHVHLNKGIEFVTEPSSLRAVTQGGS